MTELRVPVMRVPARVFTDAGDCDEVTLFLAPGSRALEVFHGPGMFFPAQRAQGGVRLYARSAVACLGVARGAALAGPEGGDGGEDDGLPRGSRPLLMRLRGGLTVEGELTYVTFGGPPRTADLLNEPEPVLELRTPAEVLYVAKAHVVHVQEA